MQLINAQFILNYRRYIQVKNIYKYFHNILACVKNETHGVEKEKISNLNLFNFMLFRSTPLYLLIENLIFHQARLSA